MLKNKQEKDIVNHVIITPILFGLIFTFLSYLVFVLLLIPANQKILEERLSNEHYEKQKAAIREECKAIYNALVRKKEKYKTELRSRLKEEVSFLKETYFAHLSSKYLNEDILSEKVMLNNTQEQFSEFIKNINKNIISSSVLWSDGQTRYYGYYEYTEDKKAVYLAYINYDNFLQDRKREVASKLMEIRFPKENYVFVLGYNNLIYGHYNKEIIENPNLEKSDIRRFTNLKKIVSFARANNESFISYKTDTKQNPEILEEKISYVMADDEWEMVIGYGSTQREVREVIEIEQKFNEKLINGILINVLMFVILFIISQALMMYFFGKTITKKFLNYKDIATLEKERIVHLLHKQNKYQYPKEIIIDELVPLAVLNKNLEFKNCTKKFSSLFEIDEDTLYGESIFNILDAKNFTAIEEFQKSNSKDLELRDASFKTFKKGTIWLSMKVKKDNNEDGIVFTIICEEVSEKMDIKSKYNEEQRKNLIQEQIILQQSKLAAIGATVDSIAHQWKQPLAVVSGEINNLILKVRRNKNNNNTIELSFLKEHIEKIEETINFLSDTVTVFNTFYDAGDESAEVDITKLVRDTFKIMIPSTSSNVYNIIYDTQEGVYAYGVRGLYQQVILTLIHNAIEAFNENKIKNREFTVHVKNEANYNICIIEDNAGGIKEEVISKIFEHNFSTKIKNQSGNSGLGLFLARVVLTEKFEEGTIEAHLTKNGTAFIIKTKNRNKLN